MLAGWIAKLLPEGNLKHRFLDVEEIEALPVAEAGVSDDGVPFIRLEGGPIFYGYPPARVHVLVYAILASFPLRRRIPVVAYKVAWDILHRYWQGGQCNQQAHYHLQPGDTVIEAGAFIGYYTLKMANDVGPNGRVVCIEPVKDNRDIILRNLEANGIRNVTVLPYAVAEERREATLYIEKWQKNSLASEVCKGEGREIRVKVETIDNLVAELGISSPNLVIITVNGLEFEVLQGMKKVLEEADPHLVIAAKYVVGKEAVLDCVLEFLSSMNYDVILDRYGFVKNEDPERQAVVYASKRKA